jgi:protein translocase SecG subunit
MKEAILIVQIATSIALVGFILVQVKGTGFGRVWGGSTSFTRRGLERLIFKLTFVATFVLIGISILALAV